MRETSNEANIIERSKVLVWDESTMAPSAALNAVDGLLKAIMKNNLPFGGKALLLGGDFRQTLPVVVRGSRSATVEASIKFNRYWKNFKILNLTSNVRSIDPEFSAFLIKIGNGELLNSDGLAEDIIEIPHNYLIQGSLITEVFGEKLLVPEVEQFSKEAILCPKNSDVDSINEQVLNILEGIPQSYLSSDTIDETTDEDGRNYPIEFLNSLTPSGMPSHKLNLKVGAIIMLLLKFKHKKRSLQRHPSYRERTQGKYYSCPSFDWIGRRRGCLYSKN